MTAIAKGMAATDREITSPQLNHVAANHIPVQSYARAGGLLYLVIIVIGVLGEALIRNSLIVAGDPRMTALRIIESEWLWRIGVAGQYLLLACAVGLTLIWYVLLRPVHRNLALLMALFGLISLAAESVSAMHLQAVLTPLTNAGLGNTRDAAQLHAAAYLSIVNHADAFGLALMFFGIECLIAGYLIRKSGYLPAAIGWLMQIAGACYLVNTFSMVLFPSFANMMFPAILVPCFIGESVFCLWLIVKGVHAENWMRSAAQSSPSGSPGLPA